MNNSALNDLIKNTYSNLEKTKGLIITKHNYCNKKGLKLLQYGYDFYLNEESNTVGYYWWDMCNIKKQIDNFQLEEFEQALKTFFEENYGSIVSNIKSLYVGTIEPEKMGTY